MPRKQLITKTVTSTKANSTVKSKNMKYESTQQLTDLRVECLNKDKTIQEHERYIEEMKEDLRKLEAELEKLRKKQIETEAQHAKDIETMVSTIFFNTETTSRTLRDDSISLMRSHNSQAKLQREVMNNHDNQHQVDMTLLRSQLLQVSEEKGQEISVRKVMEIELRNRAAELARRIESLETELCAKKEENKMRVN